MARKIIAGNWKMNLVHKDAINLIGKISDFCESETLNGIEVVVAPTFLDLVEANEITNGKKLNIAAQDCNDQEVGAYTGEVSTEMLKAINNQIVIIGHSERREYYGDTDEFVNSKLKRVLKTGLIPILCVGESLADRKAANQEKVVASQLEGALRGLEADDLADLTIAYEPVWAIGTGETASPQQAQDMHQFIRTYLNANYNAIVSEETSILYGGSVKPDNAKELFSQPDIDGGLIGGASLKYDDFTQLIKIGVEVLR